MSMLDPAFQEPGYSLSGSVQQNKQSRAARKRPYATSGWAVDGYEQVNAPLISSSHNLAYPSSFQGPNPSQANFHGGTFIDGNVNYIQQHGEPGLQILFQATAPGAFHDSAARFPQPKCHPETREEILEELFQWCSTCDAPNILWLHGPAGAGKSAIAQSLCERLESEKRLDASFFFKRGDTLRGNGNRLFPTIACQKNPAIVEKSLSIQLKNLIMDPCEAVLSGPHNPLSLLSTGLTSARVNKSNKHYCARSGMLPTRIFLYASLSQVDQKHIFKRLLGGPLESVHHPFNINQSFDDVKKYLRDELSRIYHEHSDTMATVPTPWPPSHIVRELVDKSSGYFVYASTRLAVILANKNTEFNSPFGALDQLYLDILSTVPKAHCFHLIAILMITASEQLKNLKVSIAEELLELQPGDTRRILRRLRSLVDIHMYSGYMFSGDSDDTLNTRIFHHASFLDFLQDSTRSKHFSIDQPQHKTRLAHYMLKAFSYDEVRIWMRHCGKSDSRDTYADIIKFITSVPPSADLTSLLYSFNPKALYTVLEWLQSSPESVEEDIINLWEDNILAQQISSPPKVNNTQIFPIMQAYHILQLGDHHWVPWLPSVCLLLGFSWGEMRTAISSLRSSQKNLQLAVESLFLWVIMMHQDTECLKTMATNSISFLNLRNTPSKEMFYLYDRIIRTTAPYNTIGSSKVHAYHNVIKWLQVSRIHVCLHMAP
ncbi:hypothetical protein B0H13DRAFT_2076305 [Mycena leptocephala]|nr:hypothetical protein B0H13DRAFT_2076305 [Mycena leptocephala]